MKMMKYAILAATLGAVGLTAVPAEARPHQRHKVCTTKWVHHHKVRRCSWR
jgi:hypothetical protein